MARDIKIEDYTYDLPPDKIAKAPLPNRSDSKLLVYKNGSIVDSKFKDIVSHLPPNCSLVFNNTKVVCARLLFDNPGTSNKPIEIFVLEPTAGLTIEQAMLQKGACTWICLVGNMRHFTVDALVKSFHVNNAEFKLTAFKPTPCGDAFEVRFEWDADLSFAELLNLAGIIPLPPYLKRIPDENDKTRYQTVYAKQEGSVAAPTACLNLTIVILSHLHSMGISTEYVVLHVGAGNFKPVKSETMQDHDMHSEEIIVSKSTIQGLIRNVDNLIAVGTTSLRTLESLFRVGLKLHLGIADLNIRQWDAYDLETPNDFTYHTALQTIIDFLEASDLDGISTKTQLLIAPGYKIRSVKGIITNFHQPNSTLLLLVAALVGNDWRTIYNHALSNDYRFLSYGDGSLLM
ncbi:MAG: S-adenosylmethionine:tRNA ribosyltransferase-isomerase, partial [Bacteroidota bacterium]